MLTIAEAAALAGVNPAYFRRQCRDGAIDGATRAHGGAWTVPIESVVAWRDRPRWTALKLPRKHDASAAGEPLPARVVEAKAGVA